ncbi:uncharacterized protein METZ01_LOCUS107447, partial [marine metagenome]
MSNILVVNEGEYMQDYIIMCAMYPT